MLNYLVELLFGEGLIDETRKCRNVDENVEAAEVLDGGIDRP